MEAAGWEAAGAEGRAVSPNTSPAASARPSSLPMVCARCDSWQAAVNRPELCQGLCLVTLSLRGLNIRKQPALIKPFVAALQRTLRETSLGVSFFGSVAKPRAVKNVLRQAYAGNPDAVTDELVEIGRAHV